MKALIGLITLIVMLVSSAGVLSMAQEVESRDSQPANDEWETLRSQAEELFDQREDIEGTEAAEKALRFAEEKLGLSDPAVETSLTLLALFHQRQERYSEAASTLERVLAIRKESRDAESQQVAEYLSWLASLYEAERKWSEAESAVKRALRIYEKMFGPEDHVVAGCLENLAKLYMAQGRYGAAEPLYKQSLAIGESLALTGADRIEILEQYAMCLRNMGRGQEADTIETQAADLRLNE